MTAIRELLNAWDPIGVLDLVHDEYDCLIAPILDRLGRPHSNLPAVSKSPSLLR